MARALERAAERFEAQAVEMQERVERRRKPHGGMESGEVVATLREVARKLRTWARQCVES